MPEHHDRIILAGTELVTRAPCCPIVQTAGTLLRCEPDGLRLLSASSEQELLLAVGSEVRSATLSLDSGEVSVHLSPEGAARLGIAEELLIGRGFEFVRSDAELDRRHADGRRQLYLDAIALRPPGRPGGEPAFELVRLSAFGVTFATPRSSDRADRPEFVPWTELTEATLDLLTFELTVAFGRDAIASLPWLGGGARFVGELRVE